MKHGTFRKLSALVLAMTVILSLGLNVAFADEITSVSVNANDTGTEVTARGTNVDVEVADNTVTVTTVASGGTTEDSKTLPPEVKDVTVNVEGNVNSTSIRNTSDNIDLTVDFQGNDVSLTYNGPYVYALDVGNATVENVGEVTSEGTGTGVFYAIEADKGANVTAKSATATPTTTGGRATAVEAVDGSTVNVDTATATTTGGSSTAVVAMNGSTVNVDTATATTTGDRATATAVNTLITSGPESNTVIVTGKATATTKDGGTATGINASGAGTVQVGDVEATATGGGTATGILARAGSEVSVNNTVTATAEGGGQAIAISVTAAEDSTKVTVKEDAKADDVGIKVEASGESRKAVVEIDGTLDVGEDGTAVLLGAGVTKENIEITVWQVAVGGEQVKEDQTLVKAGDQKTAAAVEEKIQYIIKLEQPTEGATLKTVNKDGSALKKVGDNNVANEGDTVLMKVELQDGYTLTGAFNGKGEKVELKQDENGDWYVEVPKGGGVYLSSTVQKNTPVEPTPVEPTPVDPTPVEPTPVDPTPVEPTPVPPSADTGSAAANAWGQAIVKLVPENDGYTVFLTARVPSMTFLRQTLEKFAKYSDRFVISTPYGNCEISLAELLSFNEKAVNFRFAVTDTAVDIYANGELFRSIPLSELT